MGTAGAASRVRGLAGGEISVVDTRDPSSTVSGERNVDVLVRSGVKGEGAGVVVGRSKRTPGRLDRGKDTVTGRARLVAGGGNGPHGRVVGVGVGGERTIKSGVDVEVGGVNLVVGVSSLVGDNLEDVGTAVPATEGRKTKVSLDGSQGRVVGIESIIRSANQLLGDSTAEKDGEDLVVKGVVIGLVKGEQDERLVPEVSVVFELLNETTLPDRGKGDVGIVSIVGHVGSNESPLRKSIVLNVRPQAREVLDLSSTGSISGNVVKEDERVVLADVVVGMGLLVGVVVALETSMGEMLLVFAPRNPLSLQHINDGGDVLWNLVEVVVVHGKLVTSRSGGIVGLGRVSDGPEVGQGDTLGGQVLLVAVIGSIAVVLSSISFFFFFFFFYGTRSMHGINTYDVLQPDLVEILESNSLDVRDRGRGNGGGRSSLDVRERRLGSGNELGRSGTSGSEQQNSRLHFDLFNLTLGRIE